jgi:tRNA (mo5U34)-methyltransferase
MTIEEQILELAPWHLAVDVKGTSTSIGAQDGIALVDGRGDFRDLIERVYPAGLEGRSFLDCACNCGGYSIWARELGADRVLGFDVREHWIAQARFLSEARGEKIDFQLLNLYDLDAEPFDVTLFKGILYHLEDPMRGLRVAADHTKDLLIVNTATRNGYPDGALVADTEPTAALMAGVDPVIWFPTGPETLKRMLAACGFRETRLRYWWKEVNQQPAHLGRLEILAARDPKTFRAYDPFENP